MIKKISIGLLGCLMAVQLSFSQTTVLIKGQLKHVPVGSTVYLNYLDNGVAQQDSVRLTKSGVFNFKAIVSKPVIARLYVGHAGEQGLKKNSDKVFFYLEDKVVFQQSDSLRTASIRSGLLNKHYTVLKSGLLPLEREREALFGTLTDENRKSEEFIANYRQSNERIATAIKQVYVRFVQAYPSSVVSLYALDRVGGPFPEYDELNTLYTGLGESVRKSEEGTVWQKKLDLMKHTSIGALAPDFASTTPEGGRLHLKELQGQYVLLDFWASWCGPCRQESPYLIEAYKQFADKGFTILNVSLDSKSAREAWLKAIADDGIGDWHHVSDLDGFKSPTAVLYGIQAIPQNFLLDRQGKIVAKNLRGEDLLKLLDKTFDN